VLRACTICGRKQEFSYTANDPRDSGACHGCGGQLKEREAAHALLSWCGEGRFVSLASFARAVEGAGDVGPGILDVCYSSPFAQQLNLLPGYQQGYFWPSGTAETTRSGDTVPFVDLQNTPYDNASFDVVLTHDSLPFIEDIDRALIEISRILRPGGVCISIVKVDWPLPDVTIELEGSEASKPYQAPDGSTWPIRRRIGADFANKLRAHGLQPMFRRLSFFLETRRNYTIIGLKP